MVLRNLSSIEQPLFLFYSTLMYPIYFPCVFYGAEIIRHFYKIYLIFSYFSTMIILRLATER